MSIEIKEINFAKQSNLISGSDKNNQREFRHPQVAVGPSSIIPTQSALIAKDFISAYTVIFIYNSLSTSKRTRTSIQISEYHHIEAGNFGSYTNHSCSPNAVIQTSYNDGDNMGRVVLISCKNIHKGEEITFDYATTETVLTQELENTQCQCKSSRCRKSMKSFTKLSHEEQQHLYNSGLLSNHIIKQFF